MDWEGVFETLERTCAPTNKFDHASARLCEFGDIDVERLIRARYPYKPYLKHMRPTRLIELLELIGAQPKYKRSKRRWFIAALKEIVHDEPLVDSQGWNFFTHCFCWYSMDELVAFGLERMRLIIVRYADERDARLLYGYANVHVWYLIIYCGYEGLRPYTFPEIEASAYSQFMRPAWLMAQAILLGDGYVRVCGSSRGARFFRILNALNEDAQMVLCNRALGRMTDSVPLSDLRTYLP